MLLIWFPLSPLILRSDTKKAIPVTLSDNAGGFRLHSRKWITDIRKRAKDPNVEVAAAR
jgi:hypothetical protein